MFNYLLKIEYDGSNYVGWQSQKNGKSIQDKIERALKKIFKTKVIQKKIKKLYLFGLKEYFINQTSEI